jgi:NTP pyrophosphatase (non-canonical NTP hydrolase)
MIDLELIRSLTKLDGKTKVQRALKLCEETGEVAAAILSETNAPGCEYKKLDINDVKEEIADVIILAGSLIADYGFSDDEINQQIIKKCEKWKKVLKLGLTEPEVSHDQLYCEHQWEHDGSSGDWCTLCFVKRSEIDSNYASRIKN